MSAAEKLTTVEVQPAYMSGKKMFLAMKRGEKISALDRLKAIRKIIAFMAKNRDLNGDPELVLIQLLAAPPIQRNDVQ